MKITLLTHQRELLRPTNTGQLVMACQGLQVERRVWQRTVPDEMLLKPLARQSSVLLYPAADAQPVDMAAPYSHIVLLDATWQEANKMYHRSPYLQVLPCWKLNSPVISQYQLRRNQPPGALCTAEVVIALLREAGMTSQAEALQQAFELFNRAAR